MYFFLYLYHGIATAAATEQPLRVLLEEYVGRNVGALLLNQTHRETNYEEPNDLELGISVDVPGTG